MKRSCMALLVASACQSPPATPPRLAAPALVQYPEELWDAGAEGTTLLRLYVRADGSIDSAQVNRSSGFPGLDDAAVDGVSSLRFEPARQGDRPVGAWVRLPVQFRLQSALEGRPDNL